LQTTFGICSRKRRYPTEAAAIAAATSALVNLRPYRCSLCRDYHLTSRTKGMFVGRKSDTAAR